MTFNCNLTYEKNFAKHIENLPHRLSEKFIGDTISITDIALKNGYLSIIGIAQGFFEIIVIALVQKGLSCPSLSVITYFVNLSIACFSRIIYGQLLRFFIFSTPVFCLNQQTSACQFVFTRHHIVMTDNNSLAFLFLYRVIRNLTRCF